ncbi:hypothetical protein PPERSA_04615 [Pseudocohnilembus persalinus]|uniref:Fe2OG dioxygenase domain-containing protein n=1 Tax=Pseudocohnilembus persalinus TaxID=266149 RepID=A0A0V0QNT9_PSEPJ|nr:hypothetical protein PPERSA_04615 [Pseudocohnilembus persalinus]|eukprot:KRX03820.1 hypothetical protein PPERSA_04615 [Pseudocohnilembus persalinus]
MEKCEKIKAKEEKQYENQNQQEEDKKQQSNLMEIKNVPGLLYYKKFLTEEEEQNLIKQINQQTWNNDLKRRTQHYGYKYDYTSKSINESQYLGKLPDFCDFIIKRMLNEKIIDQEPDQLIINEYEPGQGINPHIDRPDFFQEKVVSISLGSKCIMEFTLEKQTEEIVLYKRSLALLTAEARYKWKHGIKARKNDVIKGPLFS